MGVGHIIKIVGVVAAVVFGLWDGLEQAGMIIAILGLVGGYFIDAEDRMRALVAAIALTASGVAAGAGAVPVVGEYITGIMTSLGGLYAAGSITCILMTIYEKLKP